MTVEFSSPWSSLAIEREDDITSQKACQIADLNLFVSSSDFFRTSVGGYFFVKSETDAEETILNFSPFSYKNPRNSHLTFVVSYTGSSINPPDLPGAGDYGTIVPNYTFITSVHGDTDVITDDKHWKTLWTGGTIDDVNYRPLLNQATYEDHYMWINRPYAKINSHIFKNPETVTNWADVSYKYKHYLEDYQLYASNVSSELYLPNWYLLKHAGIYATGSGDLLGGVYNFLSNDGAAETVWTYFRNGAPAIVNYRADIPNTEINENIDNELSPAIGYLNSFLTSSLSTTTQEYAMKKFKNVLFPNAFYNDYGDYKEGITGSMPYYNTISFETTANTTNTSNQKLREMIEFQGSDTLLLRLLKEAFLEQDPEAIATHSLQYNKYLRYLSSSVSTEINTEIKEYNNVDYRAVNFIDLLVYSYHRIKDAYEDFVIVGANDLPNRAAYDIKGTYRYFNTTVTTHLLNTLVAASMANMNITNISSLLNGQDQKTIEPEVEYNGAPVSKYNEVLAYRIEKTGISNPEDASTATQNFWFFNSTNISAIELFDTQIKYDKDYTYKIYSYNAIIGLKYRYSNLQLSRVIGQAYGNPSDGEMMIIDEVDPYDPGVFSIDPSMVRSGFCIEYYDPFTDAAVNDLLSVTSYGAVPDISDLSSEAQRIAYDLRTPSARPYRANFATTVEPSIKIIEIPVHEKTLRVLDHPPNYVSITPSFTEDDTNRLSFFGSYQTFVPTPYPATISHEDQLRKEQYLNANNILESTDIDLPTVSRQVSIDVYRIEEKPTSYESFDGSFIKTVNLEVEGFDSSYTDIYFYDIVKSNTKYYYLFRISNDVGMTGYFEEVLSAELVNDGGYKYAIFDTLFEEDFGDESFVQTSMAAKKLFQLSPVATQRSLNTTEADFSLQAKDEFDNVTIGEAEDLIWDKTFKVRLTSKKTNKKIDLNIKYLQTDDNY